MRSSRESSNFSAEISDPITINSLLDTSGEAYSIEGMNYALPAVLTISETLKACVLFHEAASRRRCSYIDKRHLSLQIFPISRTLSPIVLYKKLFQQSPPSFLHGTPQAYTTDSNINLNHNT
jgi:hypothetical protein